MVYTHTHHNFHKSNRFDSLPSPEFKKPQAQNDEISSYLLGDLKPIADKIIKGSFSRTLVDLRDYKIQYWGRGKDPVLPSNGDDIDDIVKYCERIPFIVNNVRVRVEELLGRPVKIPDLLESISKLNKASDKASDYTMDFLESIADKIIGDCYYRTMISHIYEVKLEHGEEHDECGGRTIFPSTEDELLYYREKVPMIVSSFRNAVEEELGKPVKIYDVLKQSAKLDSSELCGFMYEKVCEEAEEDFSDLAESVSNIALEEVKNK